MQAGTTVPVAFAILVGCVGVAVAQPYSASGTLTENGKTVRLESSAAVWDRSENQLKIGLFPFQINRQDVEEMRRSAPMFVAVEKPSPDPSKWPSSPFAVLVIELATATHSIGREKVVYYALHVSWLDEMNNTLSVNRNSQNEFAQEISELSGTLEEGGSLSAAVKGTTVFRGGSHLSWDFRIRTRITTKNY